ncbi:MAG: ABC transporter permease [Oscillospiraceae bacterium]|nr:ABC transporter permease [Oscillospiraceae bacterium]
MENISLGKKIRVFIKHNGRLIVGATLVLAMILMAVFAPLLTQYDPNATDIRNRYQTPSAEHIMGTDGSGNDLWAQVVYGARASLLIAFASQIATMIVGAMLGLICGFYPKVDMVIMRILEAINSLPSILLIFVLGMVFGNSYFNLILTLVIAGMGGPTRYIRAQVMSLRQKEFVEREVAMGASTPRIMFMHVLPQCSSYLLVTLGSGLSSKIMSLASMSFLGVGLPSGVPNWGTLISAGQVQLMLYPYLVFYPMIALAITNFGFSMLGDGLRDLLDPKTH